MTSTHDRWERTVEELTALTAELEADGWETYSFQVPHAAPSPPDMSEFDDPGLVFVVADNDAADLADAVESASFEEYEVFRRTAGDRLYMVARYRAPDTRQAVCFAASYRLQYVGGLAQAAARAGGIQTRFKRIDGSVVAAFEHEEFEQFLPE